MDDVKSFLEVNNLSQYAVEFDKEGYDDFQNLLHLSSNDLEEMMNNVGITKPGHRIRLKTGLRVEKSKASHKETETSTRASADQNNLPKEIPKFVEEMIIPNPINNQTKYFNELTMELYHSTYVLFKSDVQFKEYNIAQRSHRWRLKKTHSEIESRYNALFKTVSAADKDDCKDGFALNVFKFCDNDYTLASADMYSIKATVDHIDLFVTKIEKVKASIAAFRNQLFRNNQIKFIWMENELSFYDELIRQYDDLLLKSSEKRGALKVLLERGQRMFSKISLEEKEDKRKQKRTQINKTKDVKEKRQRLFVKIEEVLKSFNAKKQSEDISKQKSLTNVVVEDFDLDAALKDMKPRFHLNALLELNKEGVFINQAAEKSIKLIDHLKSSLESKDKKKPNDNSQKKIDHFFKK